MISVYDVKKAWRNADAEKHGYCLDETEEHIINPKTGEALCTVEEYTQFMRKKLHCDFECIYHEHASLTTIYRCKECGTVIFGGDDEERYDPLLKCPTCGDYKTSLSFWTHEEIEGDEQKQNTLKFYENMMKEMKAQAERKKKRGLCDWEICKFSRKTRTGRVDIALECDNLFHSGLKGLHSKITKWRHEDNNSSLIWEKDYYIPLSLQAVKVWRYRRRLLKKKSKA